MSVLGEVSYMDSDISRDYKPPFKKKNLQGDELISYLKYSREKYDYKFQYKRKIQIDKLFHPIFRGVFKLTRILSGIQVVKTNDKLPNVPLNRPVIYTISHVGKDDQAVFNEIKTKHYTILSGDYESLYNNIEGLFTRANGVLFFDMNSRRERKEVINRVVERLSVDDILCSMEGAWNISPNCLVYHIFPGMIQAALLADAVIIPIGIERFNAKLYGLNVSNAYIDPRKEIERFANEQDFFEWCRDYIRQELASLKYNLYFDKKIQKIITCKRSDIGDYEEYRKWFVNDILKVWTFTEEDIYRKRYKHPLEPDNIFKIYIVNRGINAS